MYGSFPSAPHFDKWVTFDANQYLTSRVNDQGTQKTILEYSTDYFASKAVDFIETAENDSANRPWFLYVAPTTPHGPFEPAERHATANVDAFQPAPSYLEADRTDKPKWVQNTRVADQSETQREQLRMLFALDEGVDQIMRKIQTKSKRATRLPSSSATTAFCGESMASRARAWRTESRWTFRSTCAGPAIR